VSTKDIVQLKFATDFLATSYSDVTMVVYTEISASSSLGPSDCGICMKYSRCLSALFLHLTPFSGQNQHYWLPNGRLL